MSDREAANAILGFFALIALICGVLTMGGCTVAVLRWAL
jgi:hypothetical protein